MCLCREHINSGSAFIQCHMSTKNALTSASSRRHCSGRYEKNSTPGEQTIKINFYMVLIEHHLVRHPKSKVFPPMRSNIRNIFGFSGLHEHRITDSSTSANLTENQMKIPSLLFHVITRFFGNINLFHLSTLPILIGTFSFSIIPRGGM